MNNESTRATAAPKLDMTDYSQRVTETNSAGPVPSPSTGGGPAAAKRAAERIDAMHKGVVGVFAAIKAEHLVEGEPATDSTGRASIDDIVGLPDLMNEWATVPRGAAALAVWKQIAELVDGYFAAREPAPVVRDLPPLPEMLSLADIPAAQETPDNWDADYRETWQKLQVADCNRRQWRAYALELRAALAASGVARDLDVNAEIERLREALDLANEHLRQAVESIAKFRAGTHHEQGNRATAESAVICPHCDGDGYYEHKGATVACRVCSGTGNAESAPASTAPDEQQDQDKRNAALRAAPAGQHEAGAAVLVAVRDAVQLQEPVSITKAVLAQREARVVLDKGTGPVACVILVNIQLTPWKEGPEIAAAFASGYNTSMKWFRAALLDLANEASAEAATRFRAEGGNTNENENLAPSNTSPVGAKEST